MNDVFLLESKSLCLKKLKNIGQPQKFPLNVCCIIDKNLSISGIKGSLFEITTEDLVI